MTPRPATILGPYGEGYCRWCQFVIGLTELGVLNEHRRGVRSGRIVDPCEGSHTVPPKLTPYASKKARFTCTGPVAYCPDCLQTVSYHAFESGTKVFMRHWAGAVICPKAGHPIPDPPVGPGVAPYVN